MSDHTDAIQDYEERNWEALAIDFIEKNEDKWYEFVSEKWASADIEDKFNISEDPLERR